MSTVDPLGGQPLRPEFDPYSHTGVPRASGRTIHFLLALIAIAIIARVGWNAWQAGQQLDKPTINVPQTAQTPANTSERDYRFQPIPSFSPSSPESPTISEDVSDTSSAQARIDFAKAEQRELLNSAANLKRHLDQWEAELRMWKTGIEPLLENDQGRALAATPTLLSGFRAVYQQPRPEAARIALIRETAALLTQNVESAAADPKNSYVPEQGAKDRLGALVEEARQGAESYRQARLQIEVLLQDARRTQAKTEKPLAEAMADQERTELMASITAARERLEAARKEAEAKVTAAKEEAIRLAGDAEAAKITAEAEAAKAQRDAEEEQRRREQAKQRQLAALERDMADVRRYLAPFITTGYVQPNGSYNIPTSTPAPMSLSKLTAAGALNPTREGMQTLLRLATMDNDRPHGVFPASIAGSLGVANMDVLKRAQELLKLHGDTMVEKGLLSQ